jgi:transposase-like protein
MRLKWKNGCWRCVLLPILMCMDETYVKVNGRWAIWPGRRQRGRTVILSLSRRNSKAAYRFRVKSSTT